MMTFKYTTLSGKVGYVHDVVSVTKVGTHTYEFKGEFGKDKLRVVEVVTLQCDMRCLCHNG